MEIVFDCYNFWGYEIYRTVNSNTPIVFDGDNFYTLTDNNDIDSDPYKMLNKNKLKIVNK